MGDDSDNPSGGERCGKRKRHTDLYKRNKIKAARIKGVAYVNHKGKTMPPKQAGFFCK